MILVYTVSVEEVVKEFGLINLTKDVDLKGKVITNPEVNRPALQLAGYFEHFDSERIQIIGIVEETYLEKMEKEKRIDVLKKIFSYKIPCVVMSRGLTPHEETLRFATENDIPVLQTTDSTSDFMSELIRWLKVQLAPRKTMHGVLVDVYGEGILITGESGIGKSETALELIKRGHRLVADDAVEIRRVSHETLIGMCPELIRYFIEVRGIGIINVRHMYGVQSVKDTHGIDLVVNFELWDKTKQYDRIGLEDKYIEILGNKVRYNSIPVRPGRNLALICEAAAINLRQKKMGYNSALALKENLEKNN